MWAWWMGLGIAAACSVGAAQQAVPARTVVLGKDQRLPLRLLQQLSSSENKIGDAVALELRDDVVVGGRVIARKGAPAHGSVSEAGSAGWLVLRLADLELADGETLKLKSKYDPTVATLGTLDWGEAAATAALLGPIGAALVLSHTDVVLPKGMAMVSRVAKDTTLDATKFAAADAQPASGPGLAEQETLAITTSMGDGSVTVDGTYAGEAPLNMEVKRGAHRVEVRHGKEYLTWKKTVLAQGDGLELRVNLETKAEKKAADRAKEAAREAADPER